MVYIVPLKFYPYVSYRRRRHDINIWIFHVNYVYVPILKVSKGYGQNETRRISTDRPPVGMLTGERNWRWNFVSVLKLTSGH